MPEPLPPYERYHSFGDSRLQYQHYSIFISGERRGLDIRNQQKDPIWLKANFILPRVYLKLRSEAAAQYLYHPLARQPDSVRLYEHRVRELLDQMEHWKIGRTLLDSLDKRVPVWIRPQTQDLRDGCNASAHPELWVERWGEDSIDVEMSPDDWTLHGCGKGAPGLNPLDVFFHEMVHASRHTRVAFENLEWKDLGNMKDGEELLAVMITNSFMSERGQKIFRQDHETDQTNTQDELEGALAAAPDWFESLKTLVNSNDALVEEVKKLTMPFNVFRDFDRIEKIANSRHPVNSTP